MKSTDVNSPDSLPCGLSQAFTEGRTLSLTWARRIVTVIALTALLATLGAATTFAAGAAAQGAVNLEGSIWRGPDLDDNLTRTYEFNGGGDLKMTGQDGTVYHGTWYMTGRNRFHVDINNYTREGTVVGNRITGTGRVQGRPFRWWAVRVGGVVTSYSLVGTTWRGPDYDDNLTRTYDFEPRGVLRMTGQDGTVYYGTWTQSGNRLHIDINNYTREGVISGNVINGTGRVRGRPFRWRAVRQ